MRLRTRSRAGVAAGFTLVEVLIGASLLGGLLLVAGLATDRSMTLFRQRRTAEELRSSSSRLLQRVATAIAFARSGSLPNIATGASTLTFQRCLGYSAGAVQWGPTTTIRWERESGELDDGVDNDGDELIDEGELVWIENPGLASEQRVVLAHGLCEFLPGETFDGLDEDGDGLIDERGLCFSTDGPVVTIRLGMQTVGPRRETLTKVAETSIFLRN